jgi:hypothetical protein
MMEIGDMFAVSRTISCGQLCVLETYSLLATPVVESASWQNKPFLIIFNLFIDLFWKEP